MIARLLIAVGLLVLLADCADFNVDGHALLGVIIMALGWWLNQALGRARRRLAALDATVAELNAETGGAR